MATVGDVDSGLLAHRVERLHGDDERDRAGVELEGPLAELVAIARDPSGTDLDGVPQFGRCAALGGGQ